MNVKLHDVPVEVEMAIPFAGDHAHAYPEPAGYAEYPVAPTGAFYHREMREFLLPYEVARSSPSPDDTLLAFLESTYAAAADLGGWDRRVLERVNKTPEV